MKKFSCLCLVAFIAMYGLTSVHAIDDNSAESEEHVALTSELSDSEQNLTNSRTGRILKYPRTPAFTLRRRQPVKIRSRADHYPIRSQIRRVQNGVLPQNQPTRYGYDSLKSSKYNLASKGSSLPYGNSAKGSSLRQQLLGVHPNGVHVPALSQQYVQNFKASPSYNGKVVVHPVTGNQQPTQQQLVQQDTNYPKYIKPPPPQQQQHQHQQQHQNQQQHQHPHHQQQLGQQQQQQSVAGHSPSLQYPEFKQFPIPDEQQMQKYNEQHEKYLQQQKYLTGRDPVAYYQQQQQLQQQQPQQQYQTSQQHPTQQHQQYHNQYQQQHNFAAVQQPQYAAAKPVLQHTPPSIPIHQISQLSDSSQSSSAYGSPLGSTSTPAQKMYSVYEENDMTELQNNNYQTAGYESLEKEAQEYLRFMNTNEYFLPKRDPNYKQQDEDYDRRQQYNLRVQPTQKPQTQTPVPYTNAQIYQQPDQHLSEYIYQNAYSQPIPSHQNQQQQHQQQLLQASPQLFSPHSDSSVASTYQQPIKVSQLFYQEESAAPKSSHGEPSTVVRTSYQTGYNSNQFVVSSQDHKTSKYLGSSQNSLAISTQSPIVSVNNVYSQVRQSPQQKSRTPEPIRFEFTERDAMVGGLSYTYAPTTGHLRYKAVEPPVTPKLPTVHNSTPSTTGTVLSTTLRTQTYHSNVGGGVKPVLEVEDDPEDEDDMQQAGSNLYGRQPVPTNNNSNNKKSTHLATSTTESSTSPPSDQKDTEEYCERICAIVEDEHEEIVCGSDGYMYTSEAQMECYASCLHIDVTIQGKGSCSAR